MYPGVEQRRIFPHSGAIIRAWVGPIEPGRSADELGQRLVFEVRCGTRRPLSLTVKDVGFQHRSNGTWCVARADLGSILQAGTCDVAVIMSGTDLRSSVRLDTGPPRNALEERADEFRALDRMSPAEAIAGLRELSEDRQMDLIERAFVLERLGQRSADLGDCGTADSALVRAIGMSTGARRQSLEKERDCLQHTCRGDYSAVACRGRG